MVREMMRMTMMRIARQTTAGISVLAMGVVLLASCSSGWKLSEREHLPTIHGDKYQTIIEAEAKVKVEV